MCDRMKGAQCTSCRGLMLLGAVERRGAFVVGRRDVILRSVWDMQWSCRV